MKVDIKNRHTGGVLYSADVPDGTTSGLATRVALEAAVKARANLAGAYLVGAYLAGANLAGANLAGAYLAGAYLAGANLAGAKGAELVIARTRILPEGDLIGWKKCDADVIAKLRIPAEARRSHDFGRKCRAEYADVLALFDSSGKPIDGPAITDQHGPRTEYAIGQRVTPHKWDENWQEECAGGIHFYITRDEAEAH